MSIPSRQTFDRDIAADLVENSTKNMQEIADELRVPRTTVSVWYWRTYDAEFRAIRKKECYRRSKLGDKNPMSGKTGKDHPNYKGLIDDGKGYKLILKPDWFTGRQGSKHVYYHQVVYCEDVGLTELPEGMCIHHIDGDKLNNNIENLIMLSKADHRRLHARLKNITTASED